MSSQAKKRWWCHLAHDHILKPRWSPGCGVCVPAGVSDLSISAAALAFLRDIDTSLRWHWMQEPTTEKDATSRVCMCWITQGETHGRSRSCSMSQEPHGAHADWCPGRGRLSCQVTPVGFGVNWWFISTHFPTGRSGPGSRSLAPLTASEEAVSDRWQPRLSSEREEKKNKAIASPCILYCTHLMI